MTEVQKAIKSLQDQDADLPGDLEALMTAARRMKDAMDLHLGGLKAEAARRSAESTQIPSRNNGFFYTTDPDAVIVEGGGYFSSLIRMQQDAAFVAESVIVTNRESFETDLKHLPTMFQISIVDENSRRDLTDGTTPLDPDGSNLTAVEQRSFVPSEMVFPISGTAQDYFVAPNQDYYDILPVTPPFPRGGVIRIRFWLDEGVTELPPQFTIFGYKVF